MPISPAAQGTRIQSLDGLRAISILAVIAGHATGTRAFPDWLNQLIQNDVVDIANLGVRVFFVISGFLITGLLKGERNRTGSIDLAKFFFRRTFRIFPAYAVFLIGLWFLTVAGVTELTNRDFLHALTYTTNYHIGRSWEVGHLWSLAVEEQFYLLWPLAFRAFGENHGRRALWAVVVVIPLWRVAQSMYFPEYRALIGNSFETTADALAVGCLLSLYQAELPKYGRFARRASSWWSVAALLLIGLVFSARYRPALLLGIPMVNFAIAGAVARVTWSPDTIAGRFLNKPVMMRIGVLSYSLYLWQQVFLNRHSNGWWASFPVHFILSITLAWLSHKLVERPFLVWRETLEKRVFNHAADGVR